MTPVATLDGTLAALADPVRRATVELRAWLDAAERGWAEKLSAFKRHVEADAAT